MNKFGVMIGVALALGAIPAFATVANSCSGVGTSTTVSVATIDASAVYSVLCGDKLFSSFVTTGLSTTDTVTITQEANNNYEFVLFVNGNGGSAQTLGFNVAVNSNPGWYISQIQESMVTLQNPAGTQSIPNGSTASITQVGGPVSLNALTGPGQSAVVNSGPATTSDTITFVYNPTGNSGQPAGQLSKIDYVISQAQVPEPMTFSLMGLGLVGLGLLKKRLS